MAFQLLLVVTALLIIRKTWLQYRSEQVSLYWLVIGVVLFGAMAVVSLFPQSTDRIAAVVGIGRGADLIVYIAVVCLSYGVYRLIARQMVLTREVTALAREIAIMRAEKPVDGE